MAEHPQFAEDIELLALGLLGDEDRAAIRAHMEVCAECRARFQEARALAAMLALAAPEAEPPAHLRERLLARLRAEREASAGGGAGLPAGARAGVEPERRLPGTGGGFWNWANLGWVVATVVIVAGAALVIVENQRVRSDVRRLQAEIAAKQQELDRTRALLDLLRSTDTMRMHLISGSAPWPWPEGKVYYQPKKGLLFVASNLPPLKPGMSYQLWCVPEQGAPMSAGVFWPDAHGNATVMMPTMPPPPAPPKAFAVTVEPDGGVPVPTGPQVMVSTR
jgi:anti-sigma-K factor RskA